MAFCKNHDHIYFDKLCRTKKAETVLSLIHATYQAKKNCDDVNEQKDVIAKRLVDAYNLFKFDAGTYNGSYSQFESQYTIGHELGIWKNSDLDLTQKAIDVAEGRLTIREYFDIVFLNYIQPINGKIEHLLYRVLSYADENNINCLTKVDIKEAFVNIKNESEHINSLYNMFLGTSYFTEVSDGLIINNNPKEILSCCNTKYLGKNYDEVKDELSELPVYLEYLLEDNRSDSLLVHRINKKKEITRLIENDVNQNYTLEELGQILSDMYNNAENKTTAIHMFGIKYGEIIKKNNYTAVSLIAAANMQDSYHVEVSKGVRIYESIKGNEFGVRFAEDMKVVLPKRERNSKQLYPFNQILYGAPGTGKTYSMPEYAVAIIENENIDYVKCFYKDKRNELKGKYSNYLDEGRVVFTTFHQSYGYEDFIQGLRPDVNSDELKFNVADGVFKKIADKALYDPENNYVIIIDEINRGNISKIFGELITLIEDDKRWGEAEQTSVKLTSGDVFTVPNNLYILGTMNSADKSISLVDAALRRRFSFIEIEPNSKLLNNEFAQFLDQINSHLKKELQSKDLLIGHSYFINKSVKDFDKIINKNIIPLLYEYFFDDEAKVKKALDGITVVSYKDEEDGKTYIFELEDSNVGRIKCIKKEAADIN